MSLDVSTTLNLIQIVMIIVGGIGVMWKLGNRITTSHELVAYRLKEVEADVKAIGTILVNQASQNERISSLERQLQEMKHGEGFVLPLSRGAAEMR
jgi:hypothetical protein